LPSGSATLNVSYLGSATQAAITVNPSVTITPNLNVAPGVNASTLYTGSRFFWTASPTSSAATLTLSTTIRDAAYCTGIGDISKATVSFFIGNDAGGPWSPVSSAQNLPVGFVDPADKGTGVATAISQYNLGKNQSATLWVKITVGGQYALSSDIYNVPVTVALPGQLNTLLAGGGLGNDGTILSGATGFLASGYLGSGDGVTGGAAKAGAADFAGQVIYSKGGTNPQGQLSVTIHSYNKPDGTRDGKLHTYWVKSNSIAELTLKGTPATTASFSAKTNVYDITDTKTGLDGGGTMQFTFTLPGQMYQITNNDGTTKTYTCPSSSAGCASIVIFRSAALGGGVWFSSAWGSVKPGDLPQTVEKVMIPNSGTTSIN
jgi:hypothetical protein